MIVKLDPVLVCHCMSLKIWIFLIIHKKSYYIMWRIKMKRYERSRAGFMILPSSSRSRFLSWKFSAWLDYMRDADSSLFTFYIFSCMLMGQNLQILRKSSEYFSVQHHNKLVTSGVNKAKDTNEWLAREVLRRQDNHRIFPSSTISIVFSLTFAACYTHSNLFTAPVCSKWSNS